MKITYPERDYVTIHEHNMDAYRGQCKKHLIRFKFLNPTEENILYVLRTYPDTNRFIVSNNIKIYNDVLRNLSNKKYYVENTPNDNLISFFKRNNKCIFNFENLTSIEKQFALDYLLLDILNNVEAVIMSKEDLFDYNDVFKNWSGNILLSC